MRVAHRDTANLSSCNDLGEIMHHMLPTKIETDANLIASIEVNNRRRQLANHFAYRKQANILSASARNAI